jgi:hypothetical protein
MITVVLACMEGVCFLWWLFDEWLVDVDYDVIIVWCTSPLPGLWEIVWSSWVVIMLWCWLIAYMLNDVDIVGECIYVKWWDDVGECIVEYMFRVKSYIHAYMIEVDGFCIRINDVDDVFVALWVDDFVVVDHVFVASWVDNFVVVNGTVCIYESCLGALHNLSWVIIVYVFGGCCEWWIMWFSWICAWMFMCIGELGDFQWWCLFWWNDEVWIICMWLGDLFGDDNFLVCTLKCWIVFVELIMLNEK